MANNNAPLAGRFGWAEPVTEPTPFVLDRDDYELTVQAARELNVPGHTIPGYEQLAAKVYGRTSQFLAGHMSRGDTPELSFHIPLNGGVGVDYLIAQFDHLKSRQGQRPSYIRGELWNRMDNLDGSYVSPIMLLNDTTHPVATHVQPANGYDEPGLVYTGMNVERQRRAFKQEKSSAVLAGVGLTEVGISAYIVANAKRRLTAKHPLDNFTFTQFPQYGDYMDEGSRGRGLVVAHASSYEGRLELQGSITTWDYPNIGVRRAVELPE